MSTLWSKGTNAHKVVENFTIGNDKLYDLRLAYFDVLGSIAHIKMITKIGLLTIGESEILILELERIILDINKGEFAIEDGIEDIHSQVELLLTRKVGDIGKKIHSGRSRNDQVLTDVKLYLKHEIEAIKEDVVSLFYKYIELSNTHKDKLLPGYTHFQIAMPSSFGLWFGAYAETLIDDLSQLLASWQIVNQNPLGSAAGYGSSFPLDREVTTQLLGFKELNYNSVAAQMSRGRSERSLAMALSSIASTLNKFASDCTLYMSANFGFISFPDELTTGSSIMPHKKNPDVWELIRAYSNTIQSVPTQISMLTTNLPHGYHRDFQLLKEILFPAIDKTKEIISVTAFMIDSIIINDHITADSKYDYMFTVEEVNRKVLEGTPFRDAYKEVGAQVQSGEFVPNKKIAHTHIGSIGNLSNDLIVNKLNRVLSLFD